MVARLMAAIEADEGIEEKAWTLHCKGYPPSGIADALRIREDVARQLVVERWRKDKEAHSSTRA